MQRSAISWIAFSCAALALALTHNSSLAAGGPPRPNVLLITADDLGPHVGYLGDHTVPTPNIDRLATQNVAFLNAYVTQANCSPSRASIFTSLYPHQNGQVGLDTPFSMSPEVITVFQLLKDNGYRTGVIGKVHVAPLSKNFKWDMDRSDRAYQHGREVISMAREAKEFFTASEKPFILKVSFFDPHHDDKGLFPDQIDDHGTLLPIDPISADDITINTWTKEPIRNTNLRAKTAAYYNCVKRLDYGLGLLMQALKDSGKLDNTLVIFLSDNGQATNILCGGKMSIVETGTKMPFIVSYPPLQKPGQMRQELVCSVDLFPTICEVTHIPFPKWTADRTDGHSLMRLIRGETDPDVRRYMPTEFSYHSATFYLPRRAIRDDRYKLVLVYPNIPKGIVKNTPSWEAYVKEHPQTYIPTATELYDLDNYPHLRVSDGTNLLTNGETDDPLLAAKKLELLTALEAWQYQTKDPYLRPDYKPGQAAQPDKARKPDAVRNAGAGNQRVAANKPAGANKARPGNKAAANQQTRAARP